MKLRNKILLVLGIGFVGLSASFFVVSRLLLTQSYARLESQQTNQDVQRVIDTISKDLDNLSRQTLDYSQWDDTYEFIVEEDESYIEDNLANLYIANLGINAIIYVNNSGKVVFAQGADLVKEKEVPVSQTLLNQLVSSSPLLDHADPKSKFVGIIQLPEGAMLVASNPIVTGAGNGPIRGSLIMGRYISPEFIEQLKELSKLPNIDLREFDAEQLPADFRAVRQQLTAGASSIVRPLSRDSVAGYALLKDISGKPAYILRIVVPRDIYAQGQASANYLMLAILLTGAVFSVAIVLLLEKHILSRLSHLSTSVSRIGNHGISDERIDLSGEDELSNLANTFNFVLDQLQYSQKSLQGSAERLQHHNITIADLSHDDSLVQGDALQAAKTFMEATAATLEVERVSVWLYSLDRSHLTCLDLYDRTSGQHSDGMKLYATELPVYFEMLLQSNPILVEDVSTDPRTIELNAAYLPSNPARSLLAFPIQSSGQTVGFLHCEQVSTRRHWKPEEQTFIYSIANLISLALESETLQSEVGHLLEVVSSVGDGNLTVQAQVSDRLTGLVADTLNRLVERLAQVLAQVLDAAHQVSQGVTQQRELAGIVAANAQQQAEDVSQVLHLNEQVEQAAQESAERVNTASQSLHRVAATVDQGENALVTLTQGIQILQQGSDRIMQHMKMLGEFVGLADRFVQDQGQIAFITQTLAMNASLVAARASQQTDPRQFVVLAREFESIADQVNKLAQQTNEGRVTLEQQSTQIHSVVSAIDVDVQKLGELVQGFIQGVEQSNQVFSNVQLLTADAVCASEAVEQFSRNIVQAVQVATPVMRDIAQLAAKTAELTQTSRMQSDHMEQLSTQLLENVQFFQLPAAGAQLTMQSRVDLSYAAASTIDISSKAGQENGQSENGQTGEVHSETAYAEYPLFPFPSS